LRRHMLEMIRLAMGDRLLNVVDIGGTLREGSTSLGENRRAETAGAVA
jgi:hypothetical protein